MPLRRLALLATTALLAFPAAAMAEGMPQLDFKNPLTIDQVGWGAVIFFILFLLCWKWGLPKVGGVLEERAATIAADLDAARAGKAQADAAVAQMAASSASARAEAQAAIAAAVDKSKQEAAARSAALDTQLEARLAESEQRIHAAQAAAMGALRSVATDAANALITRLTTAAPDAARVDRAVAAALAVRGQA